MSNQNGKAPTDQRDNPEKAHPENTLRERANLENALPENIVGGDDCI